MAVDTNPAAVYSSSPAFATPLHPFPPTARPAPPPAPPAFNSKPPAAVITTILPILLPPPTLRPLAFRILKKHSLNLNGTALQALATFIGRHCGSTWREEGTGEKVLEEVAKLWKAEAGSVIVEDGDKLKGILRTLEGGMVGGRIVGASVKGSLLKRQISHLSDFHPPGLERKGSSNSFGMGGLQVTDSHQTEQEENDDRSTDPRSWLKVIGAHEQPRFTYDVDKKHFLSISAKPSAFPDPKEKTAVFRERYNIILQRLQRNSSFQAPSLGASASHSAPSSARLKKRQRQKSGGVGVAAAAAAAAAEIRTHYKLTPISNLLGRGASSHLLLGMLVIAPTGTLALNDLSGSISLDLQHASPMPVAGDVIPYFCPGMIVLVDGIYEEDWNGTGSSGLGQTGGVGGTIGGRFVGFEIFHPAVEKRDVSLGVNLSSGDLGGGFGWTDFLGQGSERAVGTRMRRLEQRLLGPEASTTTTSSSSKMVILSELTLDDPSVLSALRMLLTQYSESPHSPPMVFLLMGSFTSKAAAVSGSDGIGSIEYKDLFNSLAAILSDFPELLRNSTWVFVPGDNDPWDSSFSAGASTIIPREGVPEIFTNRIKRAFAGAKNEVGGGGKKGEGVEPGEAIWTSNPTRLSLFGPGHEVVVFRDDVSGRLRRNAVRIGGAIQPEGGDEGDGDVTMSGALPESDMPLPSTEDILPSDTQMTLEDPILPAPLKVARESEPHTMREAKKLVLSLLPQSTLSPHPITVRPVGWSFATSALALYPLPSTLILGDAEAGGFCLTFEGCHVVNPGRFVEGGGGRRKRVGWVEYDFWTRRGRVREGWIG